MSPSYAGKFEQLKSPRIEDCREAVIATKPPVLEYLSKLESELASLGAVVDDLLGRLDKVCSEQRPEATNQCGPSTGPSCQLTANIDQRIQTAIIIRARIEDALNRLEL